MNKILIIVLAILLLNIELRASNITSDHNHKIYSTNDFLTHAKADTTSRQKLLNKVKENGQVKIWVYLNMKFIPENRLNNSKIFNQRSKIQKKYTELSRELESKGFFSKSDYKSKRHPVVTLVVDEEALRYLLKSEKVKKLSIVERETPHF